jgi:hypothetical protein
MPREHLILCGGAAAPAGRAWGNVPRVVLDAPQPGDGGNIHLRVEDITRAMVADLPDVVADLVELATYVYCADQAICRGGKAEFEYGQAWRRRLRFQVPVRRPDVWGDTETQRELVRLLGFLSDDDYEFAFVRRKGAPAFGEYLWGSDGGRRGEVESVMLFSGGLDSLAGAVEETFAQDRRVALVSHRPVSKIDSRQRELVDLLGRRAADRRKPVPVHVPVWANKDRTLNREYTQRTRSFLFGAIGVAVARLFGLDTLRFYENGVVSLNLPVCAQVLGGRASRTTHPQVLRRMQSLFSRLLERSIRIENPFLWQTKTDVAAGVRRAGLGELVAKTVSCAHTWEVTRDQPHCGKCSQCIDRRLAAVAAGLSDAEDPARGYRTDVLHGTFTGVEHQTMVERVVGMAHHVGKVTNATQLIGAFGEVSRVVRYVHGESADGVVARVFGLWQRHAGQVREAIRIAAANKSPAPGPPKDCLLSVSGEAQEEEQPATSEPFTLNPKIDLRIFRMLANSVTTAVLVTDLAAWADVSRRKTGIRLLQFVRHGLVHYPLGARSGAAITAKGRELLERAERDAANLPAPVTKAVRSPSRDDSPFPGQSAAGSSKAPSSLGGSQYGKFSHGR